MDINKDKGKNLYFLIFNSHFDREKGYDIGRLSVCEYELGTIDIWKASSSVATQQYKESFHKRGGYLPPEYRLKGAVKWEVITNPIDLSHHKGVKGNFYKIIPFQVETDKGGIRSDFGIHLDANLPGSMGCIVMTKDRFTEFESWMRIINNEGVAKIPLYVRYS